MNTSGWGAKRGFGIDIGGTGIKAAVADLVTGELLTERYRVATPQPAIPASLATAVVEMVDHHGWEGSVGCAFPAIVEHGVVRSAANIDKSWIEVNADQLFTERLGHTSVEAVTMINDADAAGIAEMRLGAGRGCNGVVIMITFGTGIGSAVFVNGTLVPNSELGHLELDGVKAERQAASSARKRENLSWVAWAGRVQRYLRHVEGLFSPDLFIVGGGVSRQAQKWIPKLKLRTEIVPAQLLNNAGIVGAAIYASNHSA